MENLGIVWIEDNLSSVVRDWNIKLKPLKSGKYSKLKHKKFIELKDK